MRWDEFKAFLDRRPFEPFRVYISSGDTVDIRHPETAIVSRSMFAFAVGPRKGVVNDMGWYSLIHVVKFLPLKVLGGRKARKKGSA